MGRINILDCTLRDGGYCNKWRFGKNNIVKIIHGLIDAKIDIIECGFLSNRIKYDENVTKFRLLNEIDKFIPVHKNKQTFVAMMNYGEYDADELPPAKDMLLDGIRVAFHKRDLTDALEVCRKVALKGYKTYEGE